MGCNANLLIDTYVPDNETLRQEIARQTQEFLANGGIIQQIPAGVSALDKPTKEGKKNEFTIKAEKARDSAAKTNKRS